MVVVVREGGKNEQGKKKIRTYRGASQPTPKQIEYADYLDDYINNKLEEIQLKLEERGVLEGKRGHRDRWYELGIRLREFVDNPDIVPNEIRDEDYYLWIAIAQKAPKELHPSKRKAERHNTFSKRNHFRLCYLLAGFPKAIVDKYNWRNWVTILESPAITNDARVLKWLSDVVEENDSIELRELSKLLRRGLKDYHTRVLDDDELDELLTKIVFTSE